MNVVEKSREKYLEHERRGGLILDAAIEVFNEKGYHGAATAVIAKRAGISEPTMYKYFGSKRELYLACFKSIALQLGEAFGSLEAEHAGDEIGYLKALIRRYADFVLENPHRSKFLVHLFAYRGEKGFEDTFNRFADLTVGRIEAVIEAAKKKGTLKSGIGSNLLAAAFFSQYFTVHVLQDTVKKKDLTAEGLYEVLEAFLESFL